MSDELMPCNFCNAENNTELIPGMFAKVQCSETGRVRAYAVQCDECNALGPEAPTMEEAIKKWNTRNGVQYKHTPEPEGEDNGGDVVERTDVKWYSNI